MEERKHHWDRMREYKLGDSFEELEDFGGGVEGMTNILRRLKPSEYFPVSTLPRSETNTQKFQEYINELRKLGLDVEKREDAEYGFKMPLPKKGNRKRELIIFRRR